MYGFIDSTSSDTENILSMTPILNNSLDPPMKQNDSSIRNYNTNKPQDSRGL